MYWWRGTGQRQTSVSALGTNWSTLSHLFFWKWLSLGFYPAWRESQGRIRSDRDFRRWMNRCWYWPGEWWSSLGRLNNCWFRVLCLLSCPIGSEVHRPSWERSRQLQLFWRWWRWRHPLWYRNTREGYNKRWRWWRPTYANLIFVFKVIIDGEYYKLPMKDTKVSFIFGNNTHDTIFYLSHLIVFTGKQIN